MMVRDPEERISMSEIHRHPWFTANLPSEVRDGRAARTGGARGTLSRVARRRP
jgi:hypothetical protein